MTETGESGAVDMWRLRVAMGTANSGGGDWTHYESREQLESALFAAAVEAAGHGDERQSNERQARWFRLWRKAHGGDDPDARWHVKRIVGVDHLVSGEWVEVEWSITPPVLTLAHVGGGVG